ncbi:MAG TPA: aminotransferase class V-fold PLP-dependent enzyme [Thermomicrobiaceae bacterium]|nr:aminotransferase class V-fold PLP-dependent enzyme [Thermomicrobiaceae bacterium]
MSADVGYDLEAVRRELPILREVTYLNTGTIGIMAEPVLARHLEAQAAYERSGHLGEADARAGYERARAALAGLIGARPDEVALTRNATDGVDLVAAGLALGPDDVVLTTNEEHPAVVLPWAAAERRGGAKLRLFRIAVDPDETLRNLEAALSPTTRIVVASHVSCETGVRLPITEICRRCRERGILTLVDGAQSVGQFPVDVDAIGCDFMTGNGHKWLSGPKGTGFLFARADVVGRVQPVHVGAGSTVPGFDREAFGERPADAAWDWDPTARRFEYGTRNWHTFIALVDAIAYLQGLGWEQIERHCAETSARLKERLTATPGVTLYSPREWDRSCGLVTFGYAGWDGGELARRLWDEYRVIQRRVQVPNGVRISCAYFTSSDDLDRLFDGLAGLRQN